MSGCVPITLLKGVVYKENSRGPRIELCGYSKQQLMQLREGGPNFNCLELVAKMQQGKFSGVNTFVCRLTQIIKIVTVEMLHELFNQF